MAYENRVKKLKRLFKMTIMTRLLYLYPETAAMSVKVMSAIAVEQKVTRQAYQTYSVLFLKIAAKALEDKTSQIYHTLEGDRIAVLLYTAEKPRLDPTI